MGVLKGSLVFLISTTALAVHGETLRLQMSSDQYINASEPAYRSGATDNSTTLGIAIKRDQRLFKAVRGQADIENQWNGSENWNYLNIYEAQLKAKVDEGLTTYIGRHRETWSSIDDHWKQGVFEPRYRQNKLHPKSAGLTGVFLQGGMGPALVTVGALPIHVPDLGAHFYADNGQLVSKNPWFDPPASKYRIRSPTSDIRYTVDKPPMNEAFKNPGAVAKIEISRPAGGLRLATAYKPIPQFLLSFPSDNRVIVGSNVDYLDVHVRPRIQYHTVAGLEGWASLGGWSLTGGVILDQPGPSPAPENETRQNFSQAWLWSLSASRALDSDGPNAKRLKFNVLKVVGGEARDQGEFSQEDSLFEGRFQYREAYSLGLEWPVRGLLRKPIFAEGRVLFDREQNGGSVGFNLSYSQTPQWRTDIGAEWLGLLEGDDSAEGFFSTYRANDRVSVGVSYVY